MWLHSNLFGHQLVGATWPVVRRVDVSRRGRPESQAQVWDPRSHVSVRLPNGLTSGPITSLTLRLVVWEMAMSPGPTPGFRGGEMRW